MSESKLRTQSMDFAVQIVNLVKALKEKRENIISNQHERNCCSQDFNLLILRKGSACLAICRMQRKT